VGRGGAGRKNMNEIQLDCASYLEMILFAKISIYKKKCFEELVGDNQFIFKN
jgi:hypothetical protein